MDNSIVKVSAQDEHEIANLLIRWGHARDSGDWETLADCFHPDATMHISWFSGSAKDFVTRSQAMTARRQPGAQLKHVISGPWVQVAKDRAFSRCHVDIHSRAVLEGQQVDLLSRARFFDLLSRRDAVWRITKRTAVYDQDRLDPVDPRAIPKNLFDDMDLSAFPQAAKFLCYLIARDGHQPSPHIISVYSDEERKLTEECEAWLREE